MGIPRHLRNRNDVLESHAIVGRNLDCMEKLDLLITREGCKCVYFGEEVRVLDMDQLEQKRARNERRSPNATVDVVMGVEEDKVEKVLLMECRLKYKNISNIRQSDLDNKVRYSSVVMGVNPPQCKPVYFLFSSSLAPVANRRIRQFKNNTREYLALDVTQFYNLFE